MGFLDICGLTAFLFVSLVFCVARSRAILYHILCAFVLISFVVVAGRSLDTELLAEWLVITMGLILYWFGLTIVRIMFLRSVSLRMLHRYAQGTDAVTASEGIAGRLEDAKHFGLVAPGNTEYTLTAFGHLIGMIVAFCYWLFRVK